MSGPPAGRGRASVPRAMDRVAGRVGVEPVDQARSSPRRADRELRRARPSACPARPRGCARHRPSLRPGRLAADRAPACRADRTHLRRREMRGRRPGVVDRGAGRRAGGPRRPATRPGPRRSTGSATPVGARRRPTQRSGWPRGPIRQPAVRCEGDLTAAPQSASRHTHFGGPPRGSRRGPLGVVTAVRRQLPFLRQVRPGVRGNAFCLAIRGRLNGL